MTTDIRRARNSINHNLAGLREVCGRRFSFFAAVICLTAAIAGSPAGAQTLKVGAGAGAIAFNPVTNKYYVGSSPVSVIDGATNTVTNIPGTGYFTACALNTVTNKLYFITGTGTNAASLAVIDGATNTVSFIPLNNIQAWAVAVNTTTNKIYVANYSNPGTVTVVDGATTATTTLNAGLNNIDIAVNSVTNKIYVANFEASVPTMTVIDGATNAATNITLSAALVNNGTGSLMAVNTATNKIYLGSNPTAVIDGATNTVTKLGAVAGNFYITNFAYNPVTNILYVATSITGNNSLTGTGTVTAINGTTGATAAISVGVAPTAIAVDTATNTIMVADLSSNQVTEINGATNVPTNLPAGNGPYVVAVNPATNQFYVVNSGDNTVSVIAGPVVTATAPSITAQPTPQTVAAGSTVVFTAAVGGLPAPTLQWNLNGAPITGATSATLVVSTIRPRAMPAITRRPPPMPAAWRRAALWS